MSETSGGSYAKRTWAAPTTFPSRGWSETIDMKTGEKRRREPDAAGKMVEVHDCAPPDAGAYDGWSWTCPDCERVHEKRAEYWWEPEEDV